MEDKMVVSEIGEQWSPRTDPDRTEPMVAIRIWWLNPADIPASIGSW